MIVHICCSVDSFYYIKKLQEIMPEERLIGFFYDPNIHPYSEYYLRMIESARSCDKLDIPFLEGVYDYEGWIEAVRGLENEPEKGKRCRVCFDTRLEETAKKAVEMGEKKITTTLLMSPKKDFSQLQKSAKKVEEKYGVEFVFFDFRKNGGTQAQFKMAKEEQTYKQNYCGCLYALKDQREQQQRSASELYSDINKKILPNSIEEKVILYEERMEIEEQEIPYNVEKRNILNYRLLWGRVRIEDQTVRSHILPYSFSKQKKFTTTPASKEKAFFFSLEDLEITFEDLESMSYEEEMELRAELGFGSFDFSVVVILKSVQEHNYKIEINSEIFNDTKELISF